MVWLKQKPITNPHIGCLSCGAGEMLMNARKTEITANMHTRIYQGFGGWHIQRDMRIVYEGPPNKDFYEYPTLMKFENMARKDPDHDWQAVCILPLREATYQRQERNRWVLIASGQGFA